MARYTLKDIWDAYDNKFPFKAVRPSINKIVEFEFVAITCDSKTFVYRLGATEVGCFRADRRDWDFVRRIFPKCEPCPSEKLKKLKKFHWNRPMHRLTQDTCRGPVTREFTTKEVIEHAEDFDEQARLGALICGMLRVMEAIEERDRDEKENY